MMRVVCQRWKEGREKNHQIISHTFREVTTRPSQKQLEIQHKCLMTSRQFGHAESVEKWK